jgi:NAD(P)-dependent dehydrogenase (short-subunit alcohol dehydrogenase family)
VAQPRYQLRDRVALITGPARGIGAETARQLAAKGMKLSLVGLEPERLEALAEELPTETAWFECDVTDWSALEAAAAGTVERFGGIDVVIANAGIAPWGTIETMDPDAVERILEVNLLGVWRTLRTTLPHVLERRGYLLPIASLAAHVHGPFLAPYSAAKAGVEAMADGMRIELRGSGIDVGVAYFGFIDTDMVRAVGEDPLGAEIQMAGNSSLGQPAPVSKAGEALVRAIERRARRAYHPNWILPMLLAPAPFQRIAELGMARQGIGDLVRRVNERARERSQTPA